MDPELVVPNWKGAVTLPVSEKFCGEFGALSVMVMVAERCPCACGTNETLIVHDVCTAMGAAVQLLDCEKSPGFAPPSTVLLTRKEAVPEFVIVMLCAGTLPPSARVPKSREPGVAVTALVAATPVPVSDAVCGLPGALSATLSVAVSVPAMDGTNETLMEQVVFAASVAAHVLVCEKSAAFVPVRLIPLMVSV